MLRTENTRPYAWTDKTMSGLRANQLEACQKALAGLPSRGLFDPDCTNSDAETLFELSYYAREEKATALHTIEELRTRVMDTFPAEFALLPREEYELVMRTAFSRGSYRLIDWNEVAPAESLVRRLWASVKGSGDDWTLSIPQNICFGVMLMLAGDEHPKTRQIVDDVQSRIDDTLYLLGATHESRPYQHLFGLLQETPIRDYPHLIHRFLRTQNDYILDREGHVILIHPGLAEPDSLSPELFQSSGLFSMDDEDLTQALNTLDQIEDPLYERMLGEVQYAVRPELSPENAVDDLILLAKQNVEYVDMCSVLSSMLILRPTPRMLATLKDIHDLVPRWLTLQIGQVQ